MHESDKIEWRNEGKWIVYKNFVDSVFKTAVLLLLTGILGLLVAIYARTPEAPITAGDYWDARRKGGIRGLRRKLPMVHVSGTVSID